MSGVSFARLAQELELRHLAGPQDPRIEAVVCDSREVEPGACFVAVPGNVADGHDYLGQALDRGASVLVVQEGRETALPERAAGVACVSTRDARAALGVLARNFWDRPDLALRLVAITGTNGKTTVAHLVRHILESQGMRCGLLGTIRYETGTRSLPAPLTTPDAPGFYGLLAEMRDAGLVAAVFEASSHALDQRRLGAAEVDVAAFTNLSREHLDYHPDMAAYLDAKRLLLERVAHSDRRKPAGRVVWNADDSHFAAVAWPEDSITIGRHPKARLRLLDAQLDARGTRLHIALDEAEYEFTMGLVGSFNVENALIAAGIAHALDIAPLDWRAALEQAEPVAGRLEPIDLGGGPLVLVDYAHTPDGMRKALESCRALSESRVFVVFGCGGDRDRGKRAQMAAVALELADEIVLTLDNPRTEDPQQIFRDAEAGLEAAGDRARRIEDRQLAIADALQRAEAGDVVLIAGKGHEDYQLIGREKLPWDDRDAARRAWAERGAR